MIQAKSEIEGRIADAGALGVEENRAVGAEQYILRTDITVNHDPFCRRGCSAQCKQLRFKIRVFGGGGFEIGFEPDCLKDIRARERRGDVAVVGTARMNASQQGSDECRLAGIRASVAQFGLPQFVFGGIQVSHCKQHGAVVMGQDLRCQTRRQLVRDPVPGHFETVALDRREPVGFNFKFRQGSLNTVDAGAVIDFPDVG